jgi:GNAT superfamily N-acetyltransferase
MSDKTHSRNGLDRSLPHIGVIMEKYDTACYPKVVLPESYIFSEYKRGFKNQWSNLQLSVEQVDTLEEAETAFQIEFLDGKSMDWANKTIEHSESNKIEYSLFFSQMCDRMVFVLDDKGELVGTGSVWCGKTFGKELQRLHWIAVSPEHQGKGIAKAIVSKLLTIYNELGYSGYIYLTSQTWSYKALYIYMQFGFKPYFGEKPQNWLAVNLTSGKFEPWDYKAKNIEAWNIINEKITVYQRKCNV